MSATIRELIEERAAAEPGAGALHAPGRTVLDYAGLAALVRNTSVRLRDLGVGRGQRVAFALPNGPESAAAFLGVAACATCAPLNPTYRRAEFEFYLRDLGAVALIVPAGAAERGDEAYLAACEVGVAVLELNVSEDARAGEFELRGPRLGQPSSDGSPAPEDTALVLHTSGTTSKPKLVPLSQRNVIASARNIRSTLELAPGDRCLNMMPLFHIHGLLGVLLSSLTAGASVVATPGFSAPRFYDWLREFDPSWYSAVPTMHQAILARAAEQAEAIEGARLRLIRSSSAALPPQVLAELEHVFGVPVIEAYGMTEAAHQMACNPLPPAPRKPGSVGPAAGPEVRVLDDAWNPVAPGTRGEVAIRGENVTAGYEARPEANAESFRDGWFRTGDEGYLDDDGYLFLTGRLKEIINRGGEKVAPREIDEVLLEHPAVAQVVAFAMPHPKLGEEIAAAVVVAAGQSLTKRELLAFAAEHLADFKLPRAVVFLDEIPKGPTGKLQRIGLAERLGVAAVEHVTGAGRAPETETERLLAAIFADLLEVEAVDCASDFFALGGDSLVAVQLVQRVTEATRVTIPVYELFEQPSVERLAAYIDAAEPDASALEPLPDAGPGPHELSFAQGGIWVQERLSGGTPINNRLGAIRVRGALDVARLAGALDEVLRRHDVLRARFPVHERRPRQELGDAAPIELPVRDVDADGVEARARSLAAESFDLAAGGLYRFELLRLGEDDHVLLCVFHHIVFDGWSMSVLVQDLARAFAGEPGVDAVAYADFAAWQRARVESGALEAQLEYWRSQLAEPPPALSLPGAGEATDDATGARIDLVLDRRLHAALLELGRAEGTTLFMTLAAAFEVWLHRWSGADEFAFGTLVSGRSHPACEHALGLFANTLVLRADLSGEPSFREVLARVRATALAAYASSDVPFEVVVRELRPKMVMGRNPYFDVVFQQRNLPDARAEAGGVSFEEHGVAPGFARFDLLLEAFEERGQLHTRLEYRVARFDAESMAARAEQWVRLLDSVASQPDQPISAIDLDRPLA